MPEFPSVVLMPVVNGWPHTARAIADSLAQTVTPLVLVINQGASDDIRSALDVWADQEPRLLVWHHDPPLLSLSATWNTALDWAWAIGARDAMVVNNDIRMRTTMYAQLRQEAQAQDAYFVSGVGVREAQYESQLPDAHAYDPDAHGGPDFSCFLFTRAGHTAYRFDPGFIPAYGEDCDMHRRMMLDGDGQKIFGLNLPFAHVASGTIKSMTDAEREKFATRLDGARAYYQRKWGGPVNAERFAIPFNAESDVDGVTTPALQEAERRAHAFSDRRDPDPAESPVQVQGLDSTD